MTLPHTEPHRRMTLLQMAAAAGLLLIGTAVAIDHVALSKLTQQAERNTIDVAQLHAHLADLDQRFEQQPPATLPLAQYQSERQALSQRLDAIEQALSERPTADHLLPLESRLSQLEARQAVRRSKATTVARARTPERPPAHAAPTEPPFQILGLERRGDEVFLSILPSDAAALSQVQLLRPGEAVDDWHLVALDGATAVFRLRDKTRRLPLPALSQPAP